MKIEVSEKRDNPLQERTEVHFVIDHAGDATPTRIKVKAELAKVLKADAEKLVIDSIESKYGTNKSVGYAKVYNSVEAAMKLERKHLLKRSGVGVEAEAKEE